MRLVIVGIAIASALFVGAIACSPPLTGGKSETDAYLLPPGLPDADCTTTCHVLGPATEWITSSCSYLDWDGAALDSGPVLGCSLATSVYLLGSPNLTMDAGCESNCNSVQVGGLVSCDYTTVDAGPAVSCTVRTDCGQPVDGGGPAVICTGHSSEPL